MCTVTFIPVNNAVYITSNRDEKNTRLSALPPAVFQFESGKIIYPEDGLAKGTWISLHENGNTAVLLNGAFEKHQPTPPYSLSRGKILLAIISSERPVKRFNSLRLEKIEPFTCIIVEQGDLYECRWDGRKKYCRQLRNYRPYIWSSATLYPPDIIKKREYWFASFLNRCPSPTQNDILYFHRFSGDGDRANDLQMERHGQYSTVSIASVMLTADRGSMKYFDLAASREFETKIEFVSDLEWT